MLQNMQNRTAKALENVLFESWKTLEFDVCLFSAWEVLDNSVEVSEPSDPAECGVTSNSASVT